jgi:YVTN family beta-propeller protein
VAASARGTIIKINTLTGAILGEYFSAPDGRFRNPSRTTVDGDGNVWTANRDEADGNSGSAIKIGLLENGQCVDRNGSGVIETSTGLGDIKPWPNTGGADDNGGVSTAEDECILIYQRLPNAPNARHVSVDANNDVWVGGYPYSPTTFYKLDGDTGAPLATVDTSAIGCGGYGGLVDGNNVVWSASISQDRLLRYDVGANSGTCIVVGQSYGLGIDSAGNIWNAMWCYNSVAKITPAGAIAPGFPKPTGGVCSRGVVATADDNIWIANSSSNTVTRLDNDGNLLATVPVGFQPTGVAVDRAGKVWVTNYSSDDVMRIDPATNSVDLTVGLGAGAGPYNYSDMTGSTLIAPPDNGSWTVVHDSGIPGAVWGFVTWTADEPGDSKIEVYAASSADGVTFSAEEQVTLGSDLTVPDGQYLRVRTSFARAFTGESPILYDLTILANRPPDCSTAYPSVGVIWPPNHQFVSVDVLGVTDPDGDAVTIEVTGIRQDEPVDGYGDGRFTPDGKGVGTATAELRAERAGWKKAPGDGRVYHIYFDATDPYGYACSGEIAVQVPHDSDSAPSTDGGPIYDSTALTP